MQLRRLFLLACLSIMASTHAIADTSQKPAFKMGDATQTICADGTDTLCSKLPTDMDGVSSLPGYEPSSNGGNTKFFNQTFVDYFGWQSFVALNWPLGKDGKPSTTETIVTDTTSPRVWSAYKTPNAVFGYPSSMDCETDSEKLKALRTSKFGLMDASDASSPNSMVFFPVDPLIDRYGNFTVYDVRMNEVDINYLKKGNINKETGKYYDLTTKEGQQQFKDAQGKYKFPAGTGSKVGSIEIKTSWRIMTDKDDKKTFYKINGKIFVPATHSLTDKSQCINAELGLVGMHIMQKFTHPENFSEAWAWATFEHINNVPLAGDAAVSQVNKHSKLKPHTATPQCTKPNPSDPKSDSINYSFYNADCKSCAINKPPVVLGKNPKHKYIYKWASKQPYASTYLVDKQFGTQLVRCFEIYESAKNVTQAYHSYLGDSVWKNYMLVGVQWTSFFTDEPQGYSPKMLPPAPIYLTNTTMEPYIQTNTVKPNHKKEEGDSMMHEPGSCITCHNQAKDAVGNPSNFSFLPRHAK